MGLLEARRISAGPKSSAYHATAFLYQNASVNDALSAFTIVHPEPSQKDFRKVRVAVDAEPIFRMSHLALGAPGGAAFLERRWRTILDIIVGLNTLAKRRYLVHAVLILNEEDDWDDLRRMFDPH